MLRLRGFVKEVAVQHGLRHKDAAMTRRYTASRDKGETGQMMADLLFGRRDVPPSVPLSRKPAAHGGPAKEA